VITTRNPVINVKITVICLGVILFAVAAANLWRLPPPDPDCVLAVSLYKEILEEINIVGIDYSSLTTTLGSYAVKKTSENPETAALMIRLLKDSGISSGSVAAINASGSFPGFVLAALSACSALGVKAYVIASVGSSTYGANIPGNTIADMLLKDSVRRLDHTLLAITPGGSDDKGMELDPQELDRIHEILDKHGLPFIRPASLTDAIDTRESLFIAKGCNMLINIGGSHASDGANVDLALASGILKPNNVQYYKDDGLIQRFLTKNIQVIQILNIRKLYSAYGLDFDQNGKISGNSEKLFRWKKLPLLAALLPVTVALVLFGILRYSGINKRRV